MTQTTSSIISQFKSAIQELYGERLSKVILFGSYARGEERESSDIDFLVLLKDKKIFPLSEIEKINNKVYDLVLKYGKIISFVPATEDSFEKPQNHFYRFIKKEGITV